MKQEVRRMIITDAVKEPKTEILCLIDAVQRLGVAYHFAREIEDALEKIYQDFNDDSNNDLYIVALRFRLLRQQGFNVSSEIFNKFKDDKGNFKESLIDDTRGLLELYEAAHLRVQGEDILEEALPFAATHLESLLTSLDGPLAAEVSNSLKRSIRKSLPRIVARLYFSIYQEYPSHNPSLLQFAKLDFTLLQSLHRKELSELSKWWKDLNFATEFSFARDRLVELYFWVLGAYYEPESSLGRKILTKQIAFCSIFDDIYDAYGTYEELELFTKAIQRLDTDSINQLPDYMKLYYNALLDFYEEVEGEMAKQGNSYRVYYAKEGMKRLARACLVEAKWLHEDYIPTMEEYMSNALETCAHRLLLVVSLFGMGNMITKECFDWVSNDSNKFVRAAAIITRLRDDIVGHKFEQERDHVASGLEIYMKQYGVSEQEAGEELNKKVENAWKDINQGFLKPVPVPVLVLMRNLNMARVMDCLYQEQDSYTHIGKAVIDGIQALLIDSLPV
ncbi:hypothetical protein REPUB_Repub05bG0131200 [Reevesia pubescens]